MLVEAEPVSAVVTNTTIVGGEYGLRRSAGSLTAANVLVEGSGSACFEGDFMPASRNNMASDLSAPGPNSENGVEGWLVGPLAGESADLHLACNPLQRAAATHSVFDSGNVDKLFDGNPRSLARTAAQNPAFVELDFGSPVVLAGSRVAVGYGSAHRWTLAVANTPADMLSRSGSYRVVVPERTTDGSGLPDPRWLWDEVFLEAPETTRVIRLEVEKLDGGDDYVHLSEWELLFHSSPCDSGADLSAGPGGGFNTDIDGNWRAGAWDVGADEGSRIHVGFAHGNLEVFETEGEAVVEVVLQPVRPIAVQPIYRDRCRGE